jgi:hypothetical protein
MALHRAGSDGAGGKGSQSVAPRGGSGAGGWVSFGDGGADAGAGSGDRGSPERRNGSKSYTPPEGGTPDGTPEERRQAARARARSMMQTSLASLFDDSAAADGFVRGSQDTVPRGAAHRAAGGDAPSPSHAGAAAEMAPRVWSPPAPPANPPRSLALSPPARHASASPPTLASALPRPRGAASPPGPRRPAHKPPPPPPPPVRADSVPGALSPTRPAKPPPPPPRPAAAAAAAEPHRAEARALDALEAMGFGDRERNRAALRPAPRPAAPHILAFTWSSWDFTNTCCSIEQQVFDHPRRALPPAA